MPTRADSLALVDTNVLVYGLYEKAPQHAASAGLLAKAAAGHLALAVVHPILAELYSIITDRRRVSDPYAPDEAAEIVSDVLGMSGVTMLPMPPDVVDRWVKLAREKRIVGGSIFDVQLVAAMKGNGIARVYTYNGNDFARFGDIEVLEP